MIAFQSSESTASLVDLLHPGGVLVVTLERRQVVQGVRLFDQRRNVVLVDAEAEADHPVDPGGVDAGVLEAESGSQERGFEQQHHQILH